MIRNIPTATKLFPVCTITVPCPFLRFRCCRKRIHSIKHRKGGFQSNVGFAHNPAYMQKQAPSQSFVFFRTTIRMRRAALINHITSLLPSSPINQPEKDRNKDGGCLNINSTSCFLSRLRSDKVLNIENQLTSPVSETYHNGRERVSFFLTLEILSIWHALLL